jgi:hypothetical protein
MRRITRGAIADELNEKGHRVAAACIVDEGRGAADQR